MSAISIVTNPPLHWWSTNLIVTAFFNYPSCSGSPLSGCIFADASDIPNPKVMTLRRWLDPAVQHFSISPPRVLRPCRRLTGRVSFLLWGFFLSTEHNTKERNVPSRESCMVDGLQSLSVFVDLGE